MAPHSWSGVPGALPVNPLGELHRGLLGSHITWQRLELCHEVGKFPNFQVVAA